MKTADPPAQPGVAWKWWITIVLFLATVLTYLDRQTMSLCGPMICDEFELNNEQYGQLVAAFRWAYALAHVPAGGIADRLPLRWTYALAVGLWSAAGAAAAWVGGFRGLLKTRAVLGVGEGFNWPCATRIVANLFPPSDRGLASGVFNSGAAVGSLIAPLVILPLAQAFGWRTAFFVMGSLGAAWIVLWLFATRHGSAAHAVTDGGRGGSTRRTLAAAVVLLAIGVALPCWAIDGLDAAQPMLAGVWAWLESADPRWGAALNAAPWLALAVAIVVSLVRQGRKAVAFWMLVTVAVTVNPCWYFLNEWIPKYLHDQRGLGYVTAGLATVPIFLGADVGNLVGGGLVKWLTGRGWSLRAARGTTLAALGLLIAPVCLLTQVAQPAMVVALLCLAGLGITSIVANYTAAQQDLSFRNVGLVAGTLGLASNVCAAIVNPYIGRYIDRTGDYTLIFVLLAVLPAVSVGAIIAFDAIVHRGRPWRGGGSCS